MLELRDIRAGYGKIEVLHGLDLTVAAGRDHHGDRRQRRGQEHAAQSHLRTGEAFEREHLSSKDERLDTLSVERIVSRRIVQVPEGRQLFGPLTVAENLALGSYSRRRKGTPVAERLKKVFTLFPRLEERQGQQAGTLSGGEQQMLAIGRALMAEPRVLLLDEPSMGLAPIIVRDIFATLRTLNQEGLTMVLVEQDARIALSLAHRGLVMERGSIVLADSAAALLVNPEVQAIYFGQRVGSRAGGANTGTGGPGGGR